LQDVQARIVQNSMTGSRRSIESNIFEEHVRGFEAPQFRGQDLLGVGPVHFRLVAHDAAPVMSLWFTGCRDQLGKRCNGSPSPRPWSRPPGLFGNAHVRVP
jgi:hypothetical protein